MKCRREREGSESSLSPFCSSHCGRCPFRKFAAIELDFDPISRYTYQLFRIIHSSSEVSRSRGVEKSEVEIRGPCFDSLLSQAHEFPLLSCFHSLRSTLSEPCLRILVRKFDRKRVQCENPFLRNSSSFQAIPFFQATPSFQAFTLLSFLLVPLPFKYEVDD